MVPERELAQNNTSLSLIDDIDVSSVQNTLGKISKLQAVIHSTLKSGHDFDVIPGTGKPTLLKPGAEKVLMLFGLTSQYELVEKIEDYDKGLFAYTFKCSLLKNGWKITEGVGSCNSKEDKYRWRLVKEEDIPDGVDKSTLQKRTNKYGQTKYRIENDDTCSIANTILKMAKKRAQIDATLTVASLSEIFTQDVEDMAQFQQAEQTETMTAKDAGSLVIRFGKYKGETLRDIFKENQGYLQWLNKQDRTDPAIKKAISLMLAAAKEKVEEKKKSAKEAASNQPKGDEKKSENPKPDESNWQGKPAIEDPFTSGPLDNPDLPSDDELPF
ncbi:hypothetical protein OYT88_04710 [Sporolactobacillus sp. CQH2019]|uniref:exodeoxyribonuclease X C-terminal domain-containing protein n=1 Tax=Sporolactobacillus sp. CQH2019 TaxID=3023512 RepID=UPI002367A595|nr:hypothetical protein [Sporolactobacillus sp. CQH2019]MDD9147850.1 hypothetical protein [Sporolactobacillus sp. CQH2019]